MFYIAGLFGFIVVLSVFFSKRLRWLISSSLFSYVSYASSCGDKDRHKDKLEDEEVGFSPHFDSFVSTYRQQELYRAYDNNSEIRLRQHGGFGMADANPVQSYQNTLVSSFTAPLPRPFEDTIPPSPMPDQMSYYSAPHNMQSPHNSSSCVQRPSPTYLPFPHMNGHRKTTHSWHQKYG